MMRKTDEKMPGLEVFLVTDDPTGDEYWLSLCRTYIRADGSCRVSLRRLGLDAVLVLRPPKASKK